MHRINDVIQLWLGIQGENKSRTIEIDMTDWIVGMPNGSPSIWIKRPGDATPTATGATFDMVTNLLTWQPDEVDTYVAGEGTAEIRMTEGTVIKKTKEIRIAVSPAVTGGGTTLGSDWQSYINEVDRLKSLATAAATAAEASEEAAETAAEEAETAKDTAVSAKNAADASATAAAGSAETARRAAAVASGAATAAQGYKDQALSASGAAQTAQNQAESYKSQAQSSASNAQTAESHARTYANNASSSASQAQSSASNAAGSAATANSAATRAETARDVALTMIDDTAGAGDTDKVWSADKSATEVSDLKTALTFVDDNIFDYSEIEITTSADGWRLDPETGLCYSDASYKLVKYNLTIGMDIIKIIADDYFQFQTIGQVPSFAPSNRIGNTYRAGTYVFPVPYNATYAVFSSPVNSNAVKCYVATNKINNVETKVDACPTIKDVESIAANGYKTLSQLPAGTKYNRANTSTALSPDDKISNAYKLNKCALEIATAGTFKVGLYTASGTTATVTHVKEITAVSTGITEFDLDFLLDPTKEYYFFVLVVSGAFKYSAVTTTDKYFTIPSSAVSVGGTGTITTVSGNGLAIGTFSVFLNISASEGIANTVTVAKSGGDYTTIQDAVNHTTTETIIVYPGVYDEVVIVPNSGGRNIIGIDREKCIIRSQSGKYADAPLKIYGNFYLANMTLIAIADEAGSWYPTWDSSDNTTFASYAIHIDGWTNDWNGAKGIVRNCTFYSECNHAAGCGVQKGYTLEFENCEFIRNVTDEHYLNSNYDGAIGAHSPNVNETGTTGEHLIMRDCTVINKRHLKALQLFHIFYGATMDAEIKGCTFKDSAGIDNVIKFWNCTNAIITDMSHGNSTDECNYRVIHQ